MALTILEPFNSQPVSAHISASLNIPCLTRLVSKWLSGNTAQTRSYRTKESFSPSRLLYIGDELSSALHIVDNVNPSHEYVAISDRSNSPLRIRMSSPENELCQEIDIEGLPLGLQEIVKLTRMLGLSYIWLDALCIVKSFEDPQRPTMRVIEISQAFSNAHCTFAVDFSDTVHARVPHQLPCHFAISRRPRPAANSLLPTPPRHPCAPQRCCCCCCCYFYWPYHNHDAATQRRRRVFPRHY